MSLISKIQLGGTSPFYSTFWSAAAQAAMPADTCDVWIKVYSDHWRMFGQFITDATTAFPFNTAIADFSMIGLNVRQENIFLNAGSNDTEVINDTTMVWLLLGHSESDNMLYCQGQWNPADNSRVAPSVNHKFWINYTYDFDV